MKTKLLKLEEIRIDENIYPRDHIDVVTIARYTKALETGVVFPAITVAKTPKGFLVLVDGRHRFQAHKNKGESHIQAEVLTNLSMKEIYLEAVKRNMIHGKQFTVKEVTDVILTLQKWNLSQKQISEIVRMPAKEIKPFVAKRMIRISETGEATGLKAPLQNIAGIELSQEDIDKQSRLSGRTQIHLVESLIVLLKNDWIDMDSEVLVEKLQELFSLLKIRKFK